jgi:MFS family permease
MADPLKPLTPTPNILSLPVLVAALGYMVDMYDLFLFSIVRIPSLKALGTADAHMLDDGLMLLNLQMAGLLIGGIVWGILGDKRGRLSVLFGSILIYSLANIGNGFVNSFGQYAALRFAAGFGLAGELGAGVTLVAEILPKAIRGYGTTLVATMGALGAIAAYFIAHHFDWRASYFIGGGLGILLLLLRVQVFESGMFARVKERTIKRGNIKMLFATKERTMKYVNSILIGLPIWFVVGILITFSPEFARDIIGLKEPVEGGVAVMLAFTGQVFGDLISGFLSQYLKSRKKVIFFFLLLSLAFVLVYLLGPIHDLNTFYILCFCLGIFNGYWTLFVTVAAELFGTNLRATVATTVPNFVRGSTIPLTALFTMLRQQTTMINAAIITGLIAFAIAMVALRYLEETFAKDLDYTED